MAEQITLHANLPGLAAVTDLRAFQWKAVRMDGGGVRPATTDADSGPVYVLGNKPNSGQACELVSIGNVTKAVAGDTVSVGALVTITTSQTFVATSASFTGNSLSVLIVGQAFTAAVSGTPFALLVR